MLRKIEEAKQHQCFGSWKADEVVINGGKLRRMIPNLAEEKAQMQPNLNHKTPECSVIDSARKH